MRRMAPFPSTSTARPAGLSKRVSSDGGICDFPDGLLCSVVHALLAAEPQRY
jgi:hypothetical protein